MSEQNGTNIASEYSIIGGLIERPDRFDAVRTLRPEHFSHIGLRDVYSAMCELRDGGFAIEATSIFSRFGERNGNEGQMATRSLMDALSGSDPLCDVEYHANVILRSAARRSLSAIGLDLQGIAFDLEKDPSALAEEIAQRIRGAVVDSDPDNGIVSMEKAMLNEMTNYAVYNEAREEGRELGIVLGYDVDHLLGGLMAGNLLYMAGRPGMGKCFGFGTPVLMYDGSIKSVEDIVVGDLLMGADSAPRTVLSLARGREQMYWVRQNKAMDYRVNESHILSLKRSKTESVHNKGDILNISVRDILSRGAAAITDRYKGYKTGVEFREKKVSLDPYFLGIWLGDGTSADQSVSVSDHEVADYINEYASSLGLRVSTTAENKNGTCALYRILNGSGSGFFVLDELRAIGVVENKHIPNDYLINSRENRLRLLAGLIDSDGHYMSANSGQKGPYEITFSRKNLAEQLKFLCDSLGYRATLTSRMAHAQTGDEMEVYRVRFNGNVDEIPCRVVRKQAKQWTDGIDWTVTGISIEKDIVDDYYGFEIDGDRLFLLADCTVVHNSTVALNFAASLAERGVHTAYFTLEMSDSELSQKLIARYGGIDSSRLRTYDLASEAEAERMMDAVNRIAQLPLYLSGSSSSLAGILSRAYRIVRQRGVRVIFVDYVQLISSDVYGGNRQQELSYISQCLKRLAVETGSVVIALSQLNRAVEGRSDKRPVLSDLRDSGSLEQDADAVILLYREDYYDGLRDSQQVNSSGGGVELIVAKNRHGATGISSLFLQRDTSLLSNMSSVDSYEQEN